MPPNTRASMISAKASEKFENERVPGRISEVTVNAVFSPNAAARMNAAAPLYEECADGYSGCAGVPVRVFSHGSHVGSASAGVRPVRIAVTGRQNTYRYLLSQHAVMASPRVTFSTANRCAFSLRLSPRAVASCAATRFQANGVFSAQNNANSDCSALRFEPERTPQS